MDVWDMLWLGLIVRELMGSRLDKIVGWSLLVADALGLLG